MRKNILVIIFIMTIGLLSTGYTQNVPDTKSMPDLLAEIKAIKDSINQQSTLINSISEKNNAVDIKESLRVHMQTVAENIKALEQQIAQAISKAEAMTSSSSVTDKLSSLSSLMADIKTQFDQLIAQTSNESVKEGLSSIASGQTSITNHFKEVDTRFNQIETRIADLVSKISMTDIRDTINEIYENQKTLNNNIKAMEAGMTNLILSIKDETDRSHQITSFWLLIIFIILVAYITYILFDRSKQKAEIEKIILLLQGKKIDNETDQIEQLEQTNLDVAHVEQELQKIETTETIDNPDLSQEDKVTAVDLQKRAEQIKEEALQRNWSKRKIEETPEFI